MMNWEDRVQIVQSIDQLTAEVKRLVDFIIDQAHHQDAKAEAEADMRDRIADINAEAEHRRRNWK